ncbi:hypothetical protein [Sandaracinus amylolyticus]|uniref:Uncharacterized protein n=1 Tax=Sandaracinus amylolyticus TaxID=927083 RepID=A0A0F6YFW3_9BACT|nr:hypothetical protein [Sandaracinus amylolyticus]AKF03185.1 hypothetical protein DB32_000334 [Sandaracinus amylolyticus]
MTRLFVLLTFLAFAPPGLGFSKASRSQDGEPRYERTDERVRATAAAHDATDVHDHEIP